MSFEDKIFNLRSIIKESLSPIIGSKVAIFGLPLHGNIGDTLIAQGELDFLKDIKSKCIYKRLFIEDSPLPKLPKDCTILLQGGGDFGDVWRGIHEIRLQVINTYSDYNIVIFPQSVHYNDSAFIELDAEMLSKIRNLTICVRDVNSFEFINKHFKNNVLLVPDMAFYLNPEPFNHYKYREAKGNLYLKRIDKEFKSSNFNPSEYDISDWPTIDNNLEDFRTTINQIGLAAGFRRKKLSLISKFLHRIYIERTISKTYPKLIGIGAEFLSKYENLTLTRLHSAILSVLLGKGFTLCNNSYGKNRNFYDTWLNDVKQVKFIN